MKIYPDIEYEFTSDGFILKSNIKEPNGGVWLFRKKFQWINNKTTLFCLADKLIEFNKEIYDYQRDS